VESRPHTGNTIVPIGGTVRYDVSVHLTQGGRPIGRIARRGVLLR
jgi:hypothetical protein